MFTKRSVSISSRSLQKAKRYQGSRLGFSSLLCMPTPNLYSPSRTFRSSENTYQENRSFSFLYGCRTCVLSSSTGCTHITEPHATIQKLLYEYLAIHLARYTRNESNIPLYTRTATRLKQISPKTTLNHNFQNILKTQTVSRNDWQLFFLYWQPFI